MPPGKLIEIIPGVLLALSGTGQARAKKAAERLVDAKVDTLISFGTAGGLAKEASAGELCIPKTIITADHLALQTDPGWHADILARLQDAPVTLHTTPLFSGDEIVSSINEKKLINRQTGATAIDMESAAILETARDRQLPCLVLRAIVDSVNMQLPASVLRHTDHFGHARLLPLLADLLTHPAQIFPMIQLAACFRTALLTLKWTATKIT